MAELVSLHALESPQFKSWTTKLFNGSGNGDETKAMDNVFSNHALSVCSTTDSHKQLNENAGNGNMTTKVVMEGSGINGNKRQPVTLSWRNITVSTKKGKTILQNLNGEVRPGELTAIMGPSGAGKTTLLNLLSGFTDKTQSGEVLVNGRKGQMSSFRNLSCYVTQENIVHDYLTVKESLDIAASLKLPTTLGKEGKQSQVQKVLDSLGMAEVQDTRAGKLSGGEKKRLCIAQEIVNNPPIIFLDEPTSGLDSSSCLQCVHFLKSLAKEGRTIVCTIHQPSSKVFNLFDKVYLMTEGQRMYFGPTEELVPFLSSQGLSCPQYYNPADFVMDVLMEESGNWNLKLKEAADQLCTKFPEKAVTDINESGQDIKERKYSKSYPTSFCHQFAILTYRNALNFLRNPIITHVQVIANILTGLIAGALFYGVGNDAEKGIENIGFLNFCTFFALFQAMSATVMSFPTERAVVSREYLNNWYSTKAYFISRCLTEIPHQITLPLIFSSIAYWLTDQPIEVVRFFLFVSTLVLMAIGSQALSLIVGIFFDIQSACFVTCVIGILLTMFSGFLIRVKSMPVYLKLLTYLSLPRYTLQAFVFSAYGMDRTGMVCNTNSTNSCYEPKELMEDLDVNDSDYYIYFVAPLIFILSWRIIGYFVLLHKMRNLK